MNRPKEAMETMMAKSSSRPVGDMLNKSNENLPHKKRRNNRPLSIEGVMLHARAIIEQGRVDEFLKACKKAGFASMNGPAGLTKLTREFIAAGLLDTDTTNTNSSNKRLAVSVRRMVTTKAKMIDHCDC